ncbi:MAG TPA: hypothetical protein VNE16_14110 [Vicinamibacterales bacterium]|nr:hypothetical protein [Vicinamibacterales bacterium]
MHRHRIGLAIICAAGLAGLLAAGCTSTPLSSSATITDTFTGTLGVQGSTWYPFTVGASGGDVTITVTALSPQSTITFGIGVGTPSGSTCLLSSTDDTAQLNVPMTTTLLAGSYCVDIFDIGNVSQNNTFTMQVLHP